MQIREATSLDIPGIIAVLRASIGESKLPKSEEIWKYKHVDNPFGRSLVLLAIEDTEIVGVRAFMKWVWNYDNLQFLALRAVDTGILPEYQRKGVFKKLNEAALQLIKNRGDQFIFNTPNSKSLAGNLKMGWEKIDKLNILIAPGNFKNWYNKKNYPQYNIEKRSTTADIQNLIDCYNKSKTLDKKLYTPKSLFYLQWRYEQNPLQKYEIIADPDFYLATYIKEHKNFYELRIAEHIYCTPVGLDKIKKSVALMNKRFKAEVISYSPGLKLANFKFSGKYGPALIYRDINLDAEFNYKLKDISNWGYTLGDLELF